MPSPYLHWRKLASGRQNSEDRAEVFEHGDDLVVVVADGAGGVSGGALASAAVVETARAVTDNPTLDVHDAELWATLLKEIDATLVAKRAGETTAVVAIVGPKGLVGVSVGDSEARVIGAKTVDDLTRSQERRRIGTGRAAPLAFHRGRLDGALVIGTDGLFKYASTARIAETVRAGDIQRAADRLVALVQLPSGGFQDDVGVVVIAGR
jgi:serine/threonine protein phosphatase PrpC